MVREAEWVRLERFVVGEKGFWVLVAGRVCRLNVSAWRKGFWILVAGFWE